MNFFFQEKFLSLLSILLIPSLIAGPLIPELIIIFLSFFYVKKCLDEKTIIYWEIKFSKIFILFIGILLLSSYYSEYTLNSFQYSFFYLRFGLATLAILYLLNNNPNYLKLLSIVLFFTFVALLIDSGIQYLYKINIFGYPIVLNDRVSSFFGTELIMGSFVLRIYPLLILSCILEKKKKYAFGLFLFYSIASLVLVIISGERTSLVLFVLQLFVFFIFLNLWNKKIIFSFLIIIFFLFLLIFNNSLIKNRFYIQFIEKFFLKDAKLNYLNSEHLFLFNSALTIFFENPLLGSGPNTFKIECPKIKIKSQINNYFNQDITTNIFTKYSCSTHAHNTYFQLLSDTGILGFSFVFTIFCYLLIRFIKLIFFMKKYIFYNELLCLNTALLISLFPLTQTGNFFNNWISIVYFIALPFYLKFSKA